MDKTIIKNRHNLMITFSIIFLVSIIMMLSSFQQISYSQQQQQQLVEDNQTPPITKKEPIMTEIQKMDLTTILANTNAKLFTKTGEITTECTYTTIETQTVSDDCFNFVKDVRNAMKPIVDKYEKLILGSSNSLSSLYNNNPY